MKKSTSNLILVVSLILVLVLATTAFVSCMKGFGTDIDDFLGSFDTEDTETPNNPGNKPSGGGSNVLGGGSNIPGTDNNDKPNTDNTENPGTDNTEAPGVDNNENVTTYTLKISKGDMTYDSDLHEWVYNEYANYDYKGKQNDKYEITVEDRSAQEYFCRSNMKLIGNYTSDRTYYIEYWECDADATIYGSNEANGTGYVELTSANANYKNCVVFRNSADFEITNLSIKILNDFEIAIDEFVLTDFVIPAKGYIVLFPQYFDFLGYQKNGATVNSYMTCTHNAEFESFMAEVYN